jgi:hypothetical protein
MDLSCSLKTNGEWQKSNTSNYLMGIGETDSLHTQRLSHLFGLTSLKIIMP